MSKWIHTRLEEVESVPVGGRVVAIGVFDGVHLGHQRIVKEAVTVAESLEARPTVVTFYPHPEAVLRPGSEPSALTLPGRKAEILWELGIEEVVTVAFDQQFARLTPESFCGVVLSARLGARAVMVGENFRFGRYGAGTAADLAVFGSAHGFSVRPVPLVKEADEPVSSTRIRSLLHAGEVAQAAGLLGRPHRLEGVVVRGAGRGTGLGYPTANLAVSGGLALPGHGVYVTRTAVERSESLDSVTSVGTNPTFGEDSETRVETLLLDFQGDLYDRSLAVDFLQYMRGQEVFDDPAALTRRVAEDVSVAREVHGKLRNPR
jgi:riboflavin kinase/FMN adenylyltransferase